jgi:diaminopimelate decarboxylase
VGKLRGAAAKASRSADKQTHASQCNDAPGMEPTIRTPLEELLPETATIADGELTVGGVGAAELVEGFGTPLVVYDEATVRGQARAYRSAAPAASVVYGTKAFPSVALLRILADEGLGADVSTAGELAFAQAAGIAGERIVVHGNNKEDELLDAAAAAGALVVLDSTEEIGRARAAGVRRFLVRVTPGIEADTHEAVRTAHHGSKFGLPPDDAVAALRLVPECEGLHVHVGSQLVHFGASLMTVDWLGQYAARLRAELGWEPRIVDLGGGLGVRHVLEEPIFAVADFVQGLLAALEKSWALHGLTPPHVMFEPGRSLVARAGVTLYTVGAIKTASTATTYVTVDGGMSDNPRPALYGARYTALLANRAGEPAAGSYAIAGKHCESGDVLIERVELPEPRRGDILAVPVTGAYTLSMSSTYNAVPRPAAVLVTEGRARLIRRRETLEDLLALEM